ncbi:MAG: hypothetical protein Q4F57_07550 [Weeksellaceae bacterium]|nr:hypothetical protein [Weeksellaceae bacterium]
MAHPYLKIFATMVFAVLALLSQQVSAQLYIGENVKISSGTSIIVVEEDVVLHSDSISGDGKIHVYGGKLVTSSEQNSSAKDMVIVHNQPLQDSQIDIKSNQERALVATADAIEDSTPLPIRYINIEGLVYDTQEPTKESQPKLSAEFPVSNAGFIVVSLLKFPALTSDFYYNIPIYSYTLHKRFSDFAELYTSQNPTSIFRPPRLQG